MTPKRHQRSRRSKLPPGVRYVGRPTAFGNPIRVGSRPRGLGRAVQPGEAVRLYREYLARQPKLVERIKRELKGKDLACWCPLDQPCHADVLLEVANAVEPNPASPPNT
ncbi:MAG: DUF4326 domain-containing protein [Planctomycetota bacterium]